MVKDFNQILIQKLANRQPSVKHPGYIRAAVLLPLLEIDNDPAVLFEVRSSNLSWQPGEICFPGGRIELNDENEMNAAIRETVEELGVTEGNIEVIGALDIIISPIGVILYPFVANLKSYPKQLNEGEVAEVFTVPVKTLLSLEPHIATMEMGTRPLDDFPLHLFDNYSTDWRRRATYSLLFYQYGERVIWGLTAGVLASFLDICKNAELL